MVKLILSVTGLKKQSHPTNVHLWHRSKLCPVSKYEHIYFTANDWRKFPLSSISHVKCQKKKTYPLLIRTNIKDRNNGNQSGCFEYKHKERQSKQNINPTDGTAYRTDINQSITEVSSLEPLIRTLIPL